MYCRPYRFNAKKGQDMRELKGKCLCGSVTVRTEVDHDHMDACHCTMCRKWTGGPLMAIECTNPVEWDGEQHIGVYDSSEWAQRGFCKQCGTHLFYHLKGTPLYALPAGLLEGTEDFTFTQQIFIEQKPGNYSFANATKELTGAEVFAMFQGDA